MTPISSSISDQELSTRADVALMERIVARDQAALGELYDRHGRLVYGLIVRILRDRAEAEDAVQDVFLRVWMKSETYTVALGPPAGWVVRIARNRAIDRLRANRVRSIAAEAAPKPVPFELADSQAAAAEQHGVVARALEALPREQRLLIEQAYFLGRTQSELAQGFRLPLGTVKSRIRMGLLSLRAQLRHPAPQDVVLKSAKR